MLDVSHQFLNLNDQQLYQLAEYQAAFDTKDKKSINNSVLLTVPIIDSFARATFTDGALGNKTAAFSKSMAGWGGAILVMSAYNTALKGTKKVIPEIDRFEKNHPYISTALNLVGFWFALDFAAKGFNKLTDKIIGKYPEKCLSVYDKATNAVNKINNSWAEKKLYQPLCKGLKYVENHFPMVAKCMKYTLPLAAPVIAIAAISKALYYSQDVANRTRQNFVNLKYAQANMREYVEEVEKVEKVWS